VKITLSLIILLKDFKKQEGEGSKVILLSFAITIMAQNYVCSSALNFEPIIHRITIPTLA